MENLESLEWLHLCIVKSFPLSYNAFYSHYDFPSVRIECLFLMKEKNIYLFKDYFHSDFLKIFVEVSHVYSCSGTWSMTTR
jgi:hypothetical protein